MEKQTLDETQKERVRSKLYEYCEDGEGGLALDEFKEFYGDFIADDSPDDEEAAFMFRGIDVDESKFITFEKIIDFAEAIYFDDKHYLAKLGFRGLDENRKMRVPVNNLSMATKLFAPGMSKETLEASIGDKIGKNCSHLKYDQYMLVVLDEKIDVDEDPYDGLGNYGCCTVH